MVKHIVMWRLHEEANGKSKQENAFEFKSRLETLPAKLSSIKSMEVGIGYNEAEGAIYDMVLTTSHDSREKLAEYAMHQDHLDVVAFAKDIVAERKVVDFEY